MQAKTATAQERVDFVIKECEASMPKCYNEEFYKIHLGNAICDAHIKRLKERNRLGRLKLETEEA